MKRTTVILSMPWWRRSEIRRAELIDEEKKIKYIIIWEVA